MLLVLLLVVESEEWICQSRHYLQSEDRLDTYRLHEADCTHTTLFILCSDQGAIDRADCSGVVQVHVGDFKVQLLFPSAGLGIPFHTFAITIYSPLTTLHCYSGCCTYLFYRGHVLIYTRLWD